MGTSISVLAAFSVIYEYWYVFIAIGIMLVLVLISSKTENRNKPKPVLKIEDTDGMKGQAFEYWCATLLRMVGYEDVTVTPGSGDQGVDVVAVKEGFRYAIQCKRYSSKLGNTPVQEVYAGKEMYNCTVAMVMTNSYFTDGAILLANKTGVILLDRDDVRNMTKQIEYIEPKPKKKIKREDMWPYKDSPEIDISYYLGMVVPDRPKNMKDSLKMFPEIPNDDPHNHKAEEIITIFSESLNEKAFADWWAIYLTQHIKTICEVVQDGKLYKVKARAHVYSIRANYWDEERDPDGIGGFYVF